MNRGQIRAKIKRVLKDPAILDDEINNAIDDQVKAVCKAGYFTSLITKDSVFFLANDLSTSMPQDFHHSLLSAFSKTNRRDLIIRPNARSLYLGYDTTSSGLTIDEVAQSGYESDAVLECRPRTAAQDEVEVEYYRQPYTMAKDADVPEIPDTDDLHNLCIVSGVLVEKLPETEMDPKVIKDLLGLHGGRLQIGMGMVKNMALNSPKPRPELRRKTRFY
jgi:hypothetical protein